MKYIVAEQFFVSNAIITELEEALEIAENKKPESNMEEINNSLKTENEELKIQLKEAEAKFEKEWGLVETLKETIHNLNNQISKMQITLKLNK